MIYAYNWIYESCNDTTISVVDTSKVQNPIVRQHLEKAKADDWLDIDDLDTDDLHEALEEGRPVFPCQIDFVCTLYYPG